MEDFMPMMFLLLSLLCWSVFVYAERPILQKNYFAKSPDATLSCTLYPNELVIERRVGSMVSSERRKLEAITGDFAKLIGKARDRETPLKDGSPSPMYLEWVAFPQEGAPTKLILKA